MRLHVALVAMLLAVSVRSESCCRCCPHRRQLGSAPILQNINPMTWKIDSAGHLVPSATQSMGPAGPNAQQMAAKLVEEFAPDYLALYGKGDGDDYYELFIVDKVFAGLNTLKKQRLVYGVLKEEMKMIHALSINAYAPDSPQAAELMGTDCSVQDACDDGGAGRRLGHCQPSQVCGVAEDGGSWAPWGLQKWQELDDRHSAAPASQQQASEDGTHWKAVMAGAGAGCCTVAIGALLFIGIRRRQESNARAAAEREERKMHHGALTRASALMDKQMTTPASSEAMMTA